MTPEILLLWKSHTSKVMWGVVITLVVGLASTYFDAVVLFSAIALLVNNNSYELQDYATEMIIANVITKLAILSGYGLVIYGLTKVSEFIGHDGEYFKRIRMSFILMTICVLGSWFISLLPITYIAIGLVILWIVSLISYYVLRTGCRQLAETGRYDKETTKGFVLLRKSASYRIYLALWIPLVAILAMLFCMLFIGGTINSAVSDTISMMDRSPVEFLFGAFFGDSFSGLNRAVSNVQAVATFSACIMAIIGIWVLVTAILAFITMMTGAYGMYCGRPLRILTEEQFLAMSETKDSAESANGTTPTTDENTEATNVESVVAETENETVYEHETENRKAKTYGLYALPVFVIIMLGILLYTIASPSKSEEASTDDTETIAEEETKSYVMVTADNVNLRLAPSINADCLMSCGDRYHRPQKIHAWSGQTYELIADEGEWFKIRIDLDDTSETEVYISSQYAVIIGNEEVQQEYDDEYL